jgi:hypothetical protein
MVKYTDVTQNTYVQTCTVTAHTSWDNLYIYIYTYDRLCSLVVRVPGYRTRGPGSIPGATIFSETWWVCNEFHSAS